MGDMTFGLFSLATWRDGSGPVENNIGGIIEQVEKADELGFDIAWFAEHHFSNLCVCPSPLLIAAHCAARTKRIRMGTAVPGLPFHNPKRLVARIAYVHIRGPGRPLLRTRTSHHADQ